MTASPVGGVTGAAAVKGLPSAVAPPLPCPPPPPSRDSCHYVCSLRFVGLQYWGWGMGSMSVLMALRQERVSAKDNHSKDAPTAAWPAAGCCK